ncbi:unnamed protein product [Boreogadus saida]
MSENILLSAASMLFTGATYRYVAYWAELLNLQLPKKETLYDIQSCYLMPAIEEAHREQEKNLVSMLRRKNLAGGLSKVKLVTTDKNVSLRKIMEEGLEVQDGTEGPTKELGIMHAFDPWLTTKGVKEKLLTASKRESNEELYPCIQCVQPHVVVMQLIEGRRTDRLSLPLKERQEVEEEGFHASKRHNLFPLTEESREWGRNGSFNCRLQKKNLRFFLC